jgi:hypothetical protein
MKKVLESRRNFLKIASMAAGATFLSSGYTFGEIDAAAMRQSTHSGDVPGPAQPNYTLRIKTAPVEIAKNRILSLTTYNGQFPGPLLRLKPLPFPGVVLSRLKRQHGERVSVQLIDLAIKLDHFENPPEAQIFDVERVLRKNHFSHRILRKLVYENLMLRTSDGRIMQRLGALFDIETSRPQFLLNKPPRNSRE